MRRPDPAFPHEPRPAAPEALPDPVADLLRRAERHPLGVAYVAEGLQESVAATFGVHAFVVDAAREWLRGATVPTRS